MQRILTVVAALLLLVSGAALTQSEGWLTRFSVEPEAEQQEALTPWQFGQEHWFVVVVDFPDATTGETGLGVGQAAALMDGEIRDYLALMSGDDDIMFTVHSEVVRAEEASSTYGKDSSAGRDFSTDGTFLPAQLVVDVLETMNSEEVEWDRHDLDDDGVVDRLLVLHTSRGQETGSGGTDRIWSHFTHLMEPFEVQDNLAVAHYSMATMRGGTGAGGTVVHEMLHQLGAIDLYPVHDPAWTGTWHGVGDWDIMASGNWNGGGVWPALPTAASMQLIGLDTSTEVVLDFPVQRDGLCLGPTMDLTPRHEGGEILRIDLTEDQRVFIELKGGNTFDERLPGTGVLVTLLDDAAGDPADNEVNVDSGRPWLRVVEADEDDGLLTGADDGTDGDTFQTGDVFGAEGVLIRDHRGVLVPWTAEVVQRSDGNGTAIAFRAPECGHGLTVDVPPYGLRVNANSPLSLRLMNTDAPCTLTGSLRMDFGGIVTFDSTLLNAGAHVVELRPETPLVGDVVDRLSGTLTCSGTEVNLDMPITVLNRLPQETRVEDTIPVQASSVVTVDVRNAGHGSSTYTVLIEGPLSRVAAAPDRITLDADLMPLELSIDPAGLLEEGMLVRGEIHLVDLDGGRTVLPVTLTAEDEPVGLDRFRQPEMAVGLSLMLIGLSFLWPRNRSNPDPPQADRKEMEVVREVRLDAWGRPIDQHDAVVQGGPEGHGEPQPIDHQLQ